MLRFQRTAPIMSEITPAPNITQATVVAVLAFLQDVEDILLKSAMLQRLWTWLTDPLKSTPGTSQMTSQPKIKKAPRMTRARTP
jgi:hypothetical protein